MKPRLAGILVGVVVSLAVPLAWASPQAERQSQIDTSGIDLFDRGQAAHKAGRLEEAIRLYDESIALDPEFWGSHYQRGVALLQLDRAAEAERSLRRAVELEEEFAAAHAALGDALLRLGRSADAEGELAAALRIDPGLVHVRLNLANALWSRKAYAEAERELARIEADGKATAASRAFHAETLAALGRTEEALAAFGRALELDASFAPALRGRGMLRARAGDAAGAVEDLSAAQRAEPSAEVAATLADLRSRTGAAPDPASVEALRARVEAAPGDRAARLALAEALARGGGVGDATRELEVYVAATPNDAAAFDAAGDALLGPAPLEAARFYVRAARLAPQNVDYRLKLGSALVRSGKYAEALEPLEAAAAAAPGRREAHAGLAASYYGLGRYGEAAREFAWLAEREPQASSVQFYLGASLDRVGDCEGALAAFRRFLALADPVKDKSRIDDVNIRLPAIERQMDRNGCKKKGEKERAARREG